MTESWDDILATLVKWKGRPEDLDDDVIDPSVETIQEAINLATRLRDDTTRQHVPRLTTDGDGGVIFNYEISIGGELTQEVELTVNEDNAYGHNLTAIIWRDCKILSFVKAVLTSLDEFSVRLVDPVKIEQE